VSLCDVGRDPDVEAAEPARDAERQVALEDDESDGCGAAQLEAGVEGGLEGGGPAGASAPDVDCAREQQDALGAVQDGEGAVVVESKRWEAGVRMELLMPATRSAPWWRRRPGSWSPLLV
jgi:hypothetical protein